MSVELDPIDDAGGAVKSEESPSRSGLLSSLKYGIFTIGAIIAFFDYTKAWQRIAIVVVWVAIMGATAVAYVRRRA
jgi:hypothetical protein